jgi:hypothetical protein
VLSFSILPSGASRWAGGVSMEGVRDKRNDADVLLDSEAFWRQREHLA